MRFAAMVMVGAVSMSLGCAGVGEDVADDAPTVSAAGEPIGTATAACWAIGPVPTGIVMDDAAGGEPVGTATAACLAIGPVPHGVVAECLGAVAGEVAQ